MQKNIVDKRMKYIFYILIFITTSIYSQNGTIEGNIYFKNGAPAKYVSLYIKNSTIYTETDSTGFFKLTKVPYAKHRINIKHFNKEPEIISLNINKKPMFIKHRLKYNEANSLDEVLITGKTIESKIEMKGFAVNAIKMKALKLQSIQANEILDRTSGVRIRQNGGLGSHTHYNINGLSGNAIRIFINGVPIDSYGASFSLSSIPTKMIERIEVYKGVVPVELAGDALGGAINVVLNKHISRNMLEASYSFGSFNTHQSSVLGNYYNKNSGVTLKGSAFYNYSDNDYKVWGNQVYTTEPTTGNITYVKAKRFHDSYASNGFKIDGGITNKEWADELLIGIVHSSFNRDIQHGATMESVYGNRKTAQQTKLISLSYKNNHLLSKKLKIELFSSFSDLKRQITDTVADIYDWDGKRKKRFDNNGNQIGYYQYFSGAEAGNPTLQENNETVYLSRATANYVVNKNHKLTVNFLRSQFIRNSEDPLKHVDIRNLEDKRDSKKNILGLGYSFNTFNTKLKTTVFYKKFNQNIRIIEYKKESETSSIELNDVNRSMNANGYGGTIAYQLTPDILLQASAENSFRLPVARELFGNLAENLEPNYNLKPEKSTNLNLGATLGTFQFGKNEAKIKINTFIRDTKNKIKKNVREDNTDKTTEYVNDFSYISKGFDVDLFYSYNRKLDINTNVSVFNSLFNTQFNEEGLAFNWYQNRERNTPFFTANFDIKYSLNNLIHKKSETTFSTNLSYVHWFYRDWESLGGAGKDIIPTQLVNDISITHKFPNKKIAISFDAKNMFNNQVFDNYALQKPGRAFYLKINYIIF